MPPLKRKGLIRRADVINLTLDLRRTLDYGSPMFWDARPDLETLQLAWKVHGETVLREWMAEESPGSRPFGWWAFVGIPRHGERRVIAEWTRATHDWQKAAREDCYGLLHTHYYPPLQESEAEYLRRHNLLTARERKLDAETPLEELDGPRQRRTWWEREMAEDDRQAGRPPRQLSD